VHRDTGQKKFRCVSKVKGRRAVLGDLRADAERTWFRRVPEVKGRDAIVLLGASLRQRTRRDIVFGCVPVAKRRGEVEATVRRYAAHQKGLCVWTQQCKRGTASGRRRQKGKLRPCLEMFC